MQLKDLCLSIKTKGIHRSGGNLIEPDITCRYLSNVGSSMIALLQALQ